MSQALGGCQVEDHALCCVEGVNCRIHNIAAKGSSSLEANVSEKDGARCCPEEAAEEESRVVGQQGQDDKTDCK